MTAEKQSLNLRTVALLIFIITFLIIASVPFYTSVGSHLAPSVRFISSNPGIISATIKDPRSFDAQGDVMHAAIERTVSNAEEEASESILPDSTDQQDAPDVNVYDSWKDINPQGDGGQERTGCTRPHCKWISKYINSKLDWTIKPCHDFFSHVCSPKWFGPGESKIDALDFPTQNVARLMRKLSEYLLGKLPVTSWERNAAGFFRECVNPTVVRTLTRLRPRFPIWPLKRMLSAATLAKLSAYCSKYFKSHPLLLSYVGDAGGKLTNFTRYVKPPLLPVSRFQNIYPHAQERDYQRLIHSLLHDREKDKIVQGIIKLEQALARIISGEFVPLAERVVNVEHLLTGEAKWDLLLKSVVDNRREVRSLDERYTAELTTVLRNRSSALDVANFIIYSTLLHLSPLLQNMSRLIPLGMEDTVKNIPVQVQGCLRLTEKAYELGTRVLGLKALGVKEWSQETSKATAVTGIVDDLKRSLAKYAKVWFVNKGSRKDALRRLRSLRINLFGSTPHDEIRYARGEKLISSPEDIVSLLGDSSARNQRQSSFFPVSIFSPVPMYVAETHTLYLPHALFGMINNVSQLTDPIFLPLIGAPILKAMMSVIDSRGTQTIISKTGVTARWWTPAEDKKLTRITTCFGNLYASALKVLLINPDWQVLMEDFVSQGAILEPLYHAYKERLAQYYPEGLRVDQGFTADMLYFIVYTMGLCEPAGSEKYKLKYKVAIPARILVNAHLGSNERFRRTFGCVKDDEMVPPQSCNYWD